MLRNFSMVVDDLLGASARPGLWGSLVEDLAEARERGFDVIVTLTERPLPAAAVGEFDFRTAHLPVVDFSPPTMDQIEEFVDLVRQARTKGHRVLVHCQAGVGRTGTMLAAYLVSEGMSAHEAIAQVRRLRPGSIETGDQEEAVEEYAELLARRRAREK